MPRWVCADTHNNSDNQNAVISVLGPTSTQLEEFQAVMTERLLEQFRARPEGIEVMRQAFAVLGNRTARSGAVERALNQNQVYVDYVHSLIEHARNGK